MLKIGVLGAGHLGKIHLKLLKELNEYELIGFYDPSDKSAAKAEQQLSVTRYLDLDELMNNVDVVDIVTPTLSHYECAVNAIKKSKHIFIEKPLTNTLEEAKSLIDLASEADIKAQVGHVERFNPAFLAIKDMPLRPMFIEAHRLAQFNPRGTDVSVVLDLMIHDLDIILSVVKSNVKKISASGVPVVSKSPDIANARIEFDNGCVANVTCSRISMKQMRKIRMFQRDEYISMDLLEKSTELFRLSDNDPKKDAGSLEIGIGEGGEKKYVNYEQLGDDSINSIKMELEQFAQCINDGSDPEVSLLDGYNALQVAYQILDIIETNNIS